jgi:hypothetical protein
MVGGEILMVPPTNPSTKAEMNQTVNKYENLTAPFSVYILTFLKTNTLSGTSQINLQ